MTSEQNAVRAELMVACRHDVPEIIELVTKRMPEMTLMRDPEGWRIHYRFGGGLHPRDNYFMIVRLGEDGPLVGLAWVDAALAYDHDIEEPWWCINAVAVAEEFAGQGLGRQLVGLIRAQAENVGITSIYGVCYPGSAGFWKSLGASVGDLDGGMRSTEPVRMFDGSMNTLNIDGELGNHTFVFTLGDGDDGMPRLIVT